MTVIKQKLIQFKSFFHLGIEPTQLAYTISLGILAGLFPIVGVTSILCLILAFIFKLNVIIMQISNRLVAPLQLMLIVPFYETGVFVFGSSQHEADLNTLKNVFEISIFKSFDALINLELLAIGGWAVAGMPLATVCFFCIRYISEKLAVRRG